MMDSSGGMFFGGGFMWIFWIVLIVILFVAIKAIADPDGGNKSTQSEAPIEILKKRYASGDINKEEFEQRRRDLES